jgi:ketosteroid isomerase-like protein
MTYLYAILESDSPVIERYDLLFERETLSREARYSLLTGLLQTSEAGQERS